MSASVGKSIPRVDSYDKVTGRAKYTDDLCDSSALTAKVVHSTIGHGLVTAMDTTEAEQIPGVVKILTCFDVPSHPFPTAGHPWSLDPGHQDVADRHLLNRHVRYYGDDIAVVLAEDPVAADRAVRAIRVEYEEYPLVLEGCDAMKEGAPRLHEDFPGNILGHTHLSTGDLETAIQEPGLIRVEGWYDTPPVQHCHIETPVCSAYMEGGRIVVTTSTQIPHIIRRCVGQALGIPWGQVRVIKPYIGGGFGNKQDALYEPLCAWLTTQVGGRLVKLESSREETFANTRIRHEIRFHLVSWVRPDGSFAARKAECWSNQGAYASQGHAIVDKVVGCLPQLYPCGHYEGDAWTVYTNRPVAGAMRGYGSPQATFANEAHIDDIAKVLGIAPLAYRRTHLIAKGYVDEMTQNVLYADSLQQVLDKGEAYLHFSEKYNAYQNQSGPIRRGVGVAMFSYNTAVWPVYLDSSSCRMSLHQDGSVQVQLGETEIGQGADTVFSQMAADALGVPVKQIHLSTMQDTDITPYGSGAYASRQTYVAGFSIMQTAQKLKEQILACAETMTRQPAFLLDIEDGQILRLSDGRILASLGELAAWSLYNTGRSRHLTAETTHHLRNNALSLGCTFAEVEVDIPLCKVKVLNIVNIHDCGRLINPALAEAQVHGGMSMSMGYGLSEALQFDQKTGRLLNGNLLDYKLSTFLDHPHLEARFVENPEPTHPFGTKALGEPPACSGAPAIRNAVLQATGAAIDRCPLTPHVLFEAFRKESLL